MRTDLDEEIAKVRRDIEKLADDVEAYLRQRKLEREREKKSEAP
jgi:hypothetical protein